MLTVLIADYAGEGPTIAASAEDAPTFVLSGEHFVAEANALVDTLDSPLVCFVATVEFKPGWPPPLLEAFRDPQVVIASPYVDGKPWFEDVSAVAYAVRTDWLRQAGGLHRDLVAWHHHKPLAALALRQGLTCLHVAGSNVTSLQSKEMQIKLGHLYYKQIIDHNRAEQILEDEE